MAQSALLTSYLSHYEKLIHIPAAVNRVDGLVDYTLKVAKKAGFSATTLNDGTVLVSVKGKKKAPKSGARRIAYGAHLDRIGLMVDKLHDDGTVQMSAIGGLYPGHVIDGVTAEIQTDKEMLSGVITHVEAPIHSLGIAKFQKREQDWKKLRLRLDALIGQKKDGKKALDKLGVQCGQLIWLDPGLNIDKKNKTLRSRWVDNTMAVATLLAIVEEWGKKKFTPTYDTDFVFTSAEECGMGGSSVDEPITDFIAVDVSVGESCEDMFKPSISMMAGRYPYSKVLIDEIEASAKSAKVEMGRFISSGGGTDAEQARRAGFTGRILNIGVPVYGMHSIESCTLSAVDGLLKVIHAHAGAK